MDRSHMIHVLDAIATCERRGMIARRSAIGRRLVIYTGEADQPGTWIEIGSSMIDGADCIARFALRRILGEA